MLNKIKFVLVFVFLFGGLSFTSVQQVFAQVNGCRADINQDQIVDIFDYVVLSGAFLQPVAQFPRSDITGDGIIDLEDFSILSSNFLRECPVVDLGNATWPKLRGTSGPYM